MTVTRSLHPYTSVGQLNLSLLLVKLSYLADGVFKMNIQIKNSTIIVNILIESGEVSITTLELHP